MKNQLEKLRNQIDNLDLEMLELIAKRMEVVKKVGEYKNQHNIQPLDSIRWNTILENLKKKAVALRIDEHLVERIWNEIHKAALEIEQKK